MSKITMQSTEVIEGSNGTIKLFHIQSQYDYVSTEKKVITDTNFDSSLIGKNLLHYKVIIEDEEYLIPKGVCCEYSGYIPEDSILDKKYYEHRKESWEDIKNTDILNKEFLGRTINNTYKEEISREYEDLLKTIQNQRTKAFYRK